MDGDEVSTVEPSRRSGVIDAAIALVVIGAVALGAVRYLGGSPAERGVDGGAGAVALAAVFAQTAALAWLGAHRRRPWLLLSAGVALVALSLVSIAAFVLLVPAAVFLWRGVTSRGEWSIAGGFVALACTAAAIASLVVLFVHDDPREWSRALAGDSIEQGSVSDVITAVEAAVSVAVIAMSLALAATVPRVGPVERAAADDGAVFSDARPDEAGSDASPR